MVKNPDAAVKLNEINPEYFSNLGPYTK